MRNRINRLICKLTLTALIAGLIAWLPLPTWHAPASVSAQTADRPLAAPPTRQDEQAVAQLKEQGLYDSLQEAVAAARYELRWEERPELRGLPPAYHAPNPAQRMSAYFTPTGLQLAPLKASSGGVQPKYARKGSATDEWHATLRLAGYGYSDRLLPVEAAELAVSDNYIEYRRASVPVVEWYINQPAGLEQGFTLAAPPGSKLAGERLRLALELTGDLRAELAEEGRAIALKQRDGELALRYGGLYVMDASGRELPSQMRVAEGQVWLEADDEGAVYPVTVDPIFGQQVKLTASAGASDDVFGYAIAISGDTVVIGVPHDDIGLNQDHDSAYVFVRSGGSWSEQAQLTDGEIWRDNDFGSSVAISGDTIVVGAYTGNDVRGSAYVFVRSGSSWTQQAELTSNAIERYDSFGYAVAISEDTIVVGVPYDDIDSNDNQGSAFVFVRSGNSWIEQPRLTAGDGRVNDHFGSSVAISLDTIVVGAPHDGSSFPDGEDHGSTYVFVRSGGGWSFEDKLYGSNIVADAYFGHSVAISGNTIVIGAPDDDIGSNSDQGSAYVFVRLDSPWGTVWFPQQKLTASDGAAGDNFGHSVAISGDMISVGAPGDDIGAYTNQGSAYVFTYIWNNSWTQQAKLTGGDGTANDVFGSSVAISGNSVAIGAPYDDIGANSDQGSAYVFTALWGQKQKLTAVDGMAADHFGNAVSISGSALVVGASADNSGQGSAYVFTRDSFGSTWPQQIKLSASDGAPWDSFGGAVAIFNDTIVVGAPYDDLGANANQGSVYVFVRSGGAWTQQAKLTASDGAAGDYFGRAVAVYEDRVVVGVPGDDVGSNSDQGSAYVFTRSAAAWTQTGKLIAKGAPQDAFGISVALSGETVIVGASGSNSSRGSAYVFVRGGDSWIQAQKLTASDGAAGDLFGDSVAISGGTVVVGVPKGDIGSNQDQGSAYVFVGVSNSWTQQAKLTASDGAAYDQFGVSVAVYEDTIVVGAFSDDFGSSSNQGSVYVFARSSSAWAQAQKLTVKDGAADDKFGRAVAIHRNTLVVGALDDDVDFSQDRGSAYVFGLP
jgi:hypothetical protein